MGPGGDEEVVDFVDVDSISPTPQPQIAAPLEEAFGLSSRQREDLNAVLDMLESSKLMLDKARG
jgi:hypothetical protein